MSFESYSFEVRKKVAFLTSIDIDAIFKNLSESKKLQFSQEQGDHPSYLNMLESHFLNTFKPLGFQIEIAHQVDQDQLSKFLQSSDYSGIFWLSHGGMSSGLSPALRFGAIVDYHGFDITPVFQVIHPSLKVLGVISCASEPILKEILNPQKELHPDLNVITFSTPVDLKAAFLQAINKGSLYLSEATALGSHLEGVSPAKQRLPKKTPTVYTAEQFVPTTEEEQLLSESIPIKIVRFCNSTDHIGKSSFFPALRITSASGKLLTTLPACQKGEIISSYFLLSRLETSWNINVLTGNQVQKHFISFDFGELSLETHLDLHWHLFRQKRRHKPFGKFMRLFVFSGDPIH